MKSDYGYSIADCEKDRQTLAYTDLFQEYQDLIDVANRSNVSIYPVDSRGLAASDTPVGFGAEAHRRPSRFNACAVASRACARWPWTPTASP